MLKAPRKNFVGIPVRGKPRLASHDRIALDAWMHNNGNTRGFSIRSVQE